MVGGSAGGPVNAGGTGQAGTGQAGISQGTSGQGGSGQGGSGQGGDDEPGTGGAAPAGAAGTSDGGMFVDSDGDGWTPAAGDCCDRPEQCADPATVNPGAYEVLDNGVDDDCDGVSAGPVAETCDQGLPSSTGKPDAMARALGVCHVALDSDPLPERRWGLLSAQLLRADGSALADLRAATVRPGFGKVTPTEGASLVVLSTGIAADGQQTDPGPNGGSPNSKLASSSHTPSSKVSLTTPVAAGSVDDWFAAVREPIKKAGSLPLLPDCPGQSSGDAYDSVVLRLRLRAPTNALSVRLRVRFLSSEFPQNVCTSFNDQFLALLDAPDVDNGPDRNLGVYRDPQGVQWPASLPLARTSLLDRCDTLASKCWMSNTSISPLACSAGPGELADTGLASLGTPADPCSHGASTGWLTVAGNVAPGQTAELRIALWDVGDSLFDSIALLDGLTWDTSPVTAGTTP